MKKFWNWVKNEEGRTLYFDGYIAQDSWFDDDITPKKFKDELMASAGDISVWINSPGGDVFAASQIYTMLKEYEGRGTGKGKNKGLRLGGQACLEVLKLSLIYQAGQLVPIVRLPMSFSRP